MLSRYLYTIILAFKSVVATFLVRANLLFFVSSLTCSSNSFTNLYYGIINENQFLQIYTQFFPYGGKSRQAA